MPLAAAMSFTLFYDNAIASFRMASVSVNVFKIITPLHLCMGQVICLAADSGFFFRVPKNFCLCVANTYYAGNDYIYMNIIEFSRHMALF